MSRVVPRKEAFGLSLVSSDMRALCNGNVSLSADVVALADASRQKIPGSESLTKDEQVRRFFWGLGLESKWAYALPLANAVLQVFGVKQSWDGWEVAALEQHASNERLNTLVEDSKTRNKWPW